MGKTITHASPTANNNPYHGKCAPDTEHNNIANNNMRKNIDAYHQLGISKIINIKNQINQVNQSKS